MDYQTSNEGAHKNDAQHGQGNPQGLSAAKWLACISPRHRYLFALEHTGEVIRGAVVTKVPFTQAWFCGLISVRGKLHGVIDLPDFLAMHQGGIQHEPSRLGRTMDAEGGCILTLGIGLGLPCGLLVGKLEGLRTSADFRSDWPSADKRAPLINGTYRDSNDGQWLEVNLIDLVQSAMAQPISLEHDLL